MKNTPYVTDAESDTIKISIATTPEEKREIYRLRYAVYAEEIGYDLVGADHKNKLLYDELDEWGSSFYAKIGSKVVGTIRTNIGKLEKFPFDIIETYLMNKFQKFYKKNENYNFGLITKIMVDSSCRNMPIFPMLMTKVFELYCEKQVDFGFINTNFYLLPLYEYYGHRRIGKNTIEPSFGTATSLVVMPNDISHLLRINSPFLKTALARGKTQNNQVADWFHREFSETLKIINSQVINEKELWKLLSNRLGDQPNKIMPILKGLSQSEAKQFLNCCGVIVQCLKGEDIINCKDVCHELTILISGKLHSCDSYDVDKIVPGQHFGEIGLVNRTKHTSSVSAVTDTEILVLSYHFFLKFRHLYPDIARKILRNVYYR